MSHSEKDNFNDDLIAKGTVVGKAVGKAVMGTPAVSTINFKIPIINPFDDVSKIYQYATTDQEKEGREEGKKIAAEVFRPVLENLEYRHLSIKKEIQNEQNSYEAKVDQLRKYYLEYQKGVTICSTQISSMYGISPKMDTLINCMGCNGILGAIISPITIFTFTNIGLGGILKDVMDKKRMKYSQLELESQSIIWTKKIYREKQRIDKTISYLSTIRKDHKNTLQELIDLINKEVNEYCEVSAQCNMLTLVRDNL